MVAEMAPGASHDTDRQATTPIDMPSNRIEADHGRAHVLAARPKADRPCASPRWVTRFPRMCRGCSGVAFAGAAGRLRHRPPQSQQSLPAVLAFATYLVNAVAPLVS